MKRRRIALSDGHEMFFPNRRIRKEYMLRSRFLLPMFVNNAPFHRMVAKSASIETIVKALGCALSVGEEKKGERK